jgi:hypothetical protein
VRFQVVGSRRFVIRENAFAPALGSDQLEPAAMAIAPTVRVGLSMAVAAEHLEVLQPVVKTSPLM